MKGPAASGSGGAELLSSGAVLLSGGVRARHQERETAPEWRSQEALQFSRKAMLARWAPAAA